MTRVAILSGFFLLLALPALAQEPATVGALGDPSAIDFDGNVTFTTRELRTGLSLSPDFWEASHPDAPFREFKEDLAKLVREGYLHAGFAHAVTEVVYDRKKERPRVRVVEGTRYIAAEPVVQGGEKLPLEEQLDAFAKARATYWTPGEPAQLEAKTHRWFAKSGERLLENIGRRGFRIETKIVLDEKARVARPEITILDPGKAVEITSLAVTGLVKNTEKCVIDFLAIPTGQVGTWEFFRDLKTKLEDSGRFASVTVRSDPEEAGKVAIDVVELLGPPPLGEELPERLKIMLRLRDWLLAFPESEEELHIVFDQPEVGRGEFALSPRRGFALDFTPRGTLRPYSLVVGTEEYSLVSHTGRLRLAGATGESGALARVSLTVDATNAEQPIFLRAMIGWKTEVTGSRMELQVHGSPAAFLRALFRAGSVTVEDGRATLEFSGARLVIEAATGRLLEFDGTGEGRIARVRVVESAFGPARKRTARRARDYLQLASPDSALCGLIEFAALDLLRDGPDAGTNSAILSRVLSGNVRSPIVGVGPHRETGFAIPGNGSVDARDQAGRDAVLRLVLPAVNGLFPAASWPRDVARETVLAFAGSGKRSDQVMGRLYRSKEVGPLGCLATAWLLDFAGNPAAPFFAKKGLAVATEDGFSRDIAVLVNGEGALGLYLQRLTSAVRTLSPEDRKALGALFSGLSRKHFGVLCGDYDEIADKGDRVGAYYTLLLLYRMGLDQWIRTGLESLAD